MEKITLTKVFSNNKDKEGKMYEGKFGNFYRVGIQCNEYGEEWINGFSNRQPTYGEGDTIEVTITEEEWQGKLQKKFKIARKEDLLEARIVLLEARVDKLEGTNSEAEPF